MKKLNLFTGLTLILASCGSGEENAQGSNDSTTVKNTDTVAATDTVKVHGPIEFAAADGAIVSADSYEIIPGENYILLCHQADFSRGEYTETAKRLNSLGYNCLAIDQRSGKECNGVPNLTAKALADKGKKDLPFLDAEQDIVAAIDYIAKQSGKKVIVVGSSYSASLALKIAKNNDKISALALFSPGNYFEGIDLKKEISGITIPVFATSSKEEAEQVKWLLEGIKSSIKEVYVPSSAGDHGSKVLWPDSPSKDEYWQAFESFLEKLKTNA